MVIVYCVLIYPLWFCLRKGKTRGRRVAAPLVVLSGREILGAVATMRICHKRSGPPEGRRRGGTEIFGGFDIIVQGWDSLREMPPGQIPRWSGAEFERGSEAGDSGDVPWLCHLEVAFLHRRSRGPNQRRRDAEATYEMAQVVSEPYSLRRRADEDCRRRPMPRLPLGLDRLDARKVGRSWALGRRLQSGPTRCWPAWPPVRSANAA